MHLRRNQWKIIPSFPSYAVSSKGELWRIAAGPGAVIGPLFPTKTHDGYRVVNLSRNGKKVQSFIHALVCEAFHGSRPTPLHQAAHGDGDRTNNASANLRWTTPEENYADTRKHGSLKGEKNPAAKITKAIADDIRAYRTDGYSVANLMTISGLGESQVRRILNRESWA